MLLKFSSEESAEKLLQCKYFIEKGYNCQKTFEVGISYGVIRDIETELSESDILKDLNSDIPIVNIKRLNRRNHDTGGYVGSECVRLGFKGPSLPTHVYTYGARIKVDPYIFPVTQCSNCWRFGHNHKVCAQTKITCPKCGKDHANCETTSFKCPNCSGDHIALSKVCPSFIKERRIRELMSEFNCTYKKALTLYVPPSPLPEKAPENTASIKSVVLKPKADDNQSYAKAITTEAIIHEEHILTPKSAILVSKSIRKKSNKKKKSRETNEMIEEMPSQSDCTSSSKETVTEDRKHEEDLKKVDIFELIQRIKEVVFMKRMSFEEKLKSCGKIVYEWLISSITEFLSKWPVLKTIIQTG